jgi:hypothetical protein
MSDAQPGKREFRRVSKDPCTVKPGHFYNEGQRDPVSRGPGSPRQPGSSGPPQPQLAVSGHEQDEVPEAELAPDAMMGTTAEWNARQPALMAGLAAAGQAKRARSGALSPDDLFAALSTRDGLRAVRRELQRSLGWQPLAPDVLRVVEAAFPTQHRARLEAEQAERAAAEKRRKVAAREAAAARKAADEQERLRAAVEDARQRRAAEHEAALEAEARRTLAEA